MFGILGTFLGLTNLSIFVWYSILLFFIIIINEMLLSFDPEKGLNAIGKALTRVAVAETVGQFFESTASTQVRHRTNEALIKASSIFKIIMNVNRALLYLLFFTCVVQAISPSSAYTGIVVSTINDIILFEIIYLLPVIMVLLIWSQLIDVLSVFAQLVR